MNRRKFLTFLLPLGVGFLTPFQVNSAVSSTLDWSKLGQFYDPELAKTLDQEGWFTPQKVETFYQWLSDLNMTEIPHLLTKRTKQDFKEGNLVVIQGWHLSETEALFNLAYLRTHS